MFGQVRLEDVEWARPVEPKRRSRPVQDIRKILSPGDVANFVRLEDLPPEELDEEELAEEAVSSP